MPGNPLSDKLKTAISTGNEAQKKEIHDKIKETKRLALLTAKLAEEASGRMTQNWSDNKKLQSYAWNDEFDAIVSALRSAMKQME